jgi:hypothetical protein
MKLELQKETDILGRVNYIIRLDDVAQKWFSHDQRAEAYQEYNLALARLKDGYPIIETIASTSDQNIKP